MFICLINFYLVLSLFKVITQVSFASAEDVDKAVAAAKVDINFVFYFFSM